MKLSELQSALAGLKNNPFWVAYQERLVQLHDDGVMALAHGARHLPESALRSAAAEVKALKAVLALPVEMCREAEHAEHLTNHQEDDIRDH